MNSAAMPRFDRRGTVKTLLAARGETLVVSGLGSSTYDVFAAGDHDQNFYLWGAMGSAATIGLGLAVAQPSRSVLVITGDGEMLMGLGSLATVGAVKPDNLAIVVLDNEHYGETGMQQSHTGFDTRLEQVAEANGFAEIFAVNSEDDVASLAGRVHRPEGLLFANIKIAAGDEPRALPIRDGVEIKNRFRKFLDR